LINRNDLWARDSGHLLISEQSVLRTLCSLHISCNMLSKMLRYLY
jgi:hypothetical protein